jgi:hypothetical protein
MNQTVERIYLAWNYFNGRTMWQFINGSGDPFSLIKNLRQKAIFIKELKSVQVPLQALLARTHYD